MLAMALFGILFRRRVPSVVTYGVTKLGYFGAGWVKFGCVRLG